MSKGNVLMAMSGGLDSSVAAIMLHEQGYNVIGVTMKTWEYADAEPSEKETGCCSLDSANDARAVAVKLGFPHYVLDLRNEFEDLVVSDFISEYLSGRTPNPCILCNTHIKWDALLKKADLLDCEFIATGHYAKMNTLEDRYYISKGVDKQKDQSYVLYGLSQADLKRTLLPLGKYNKDEIRDYAVKCGFKRIAAKRESYEICFIPDNNYPGFLNKREAGLDEKLAGGDFVLEDGTVIGKHKGYPYYTIGQRKGLNISFNKPIYVKKINAEKNEIVLAGQEGLFSEKMTVAKLNMVKYKSFKDNSDFDVKVRYHHEGVPSVITLNNDQAEVVFKTPVASITPGQSAVFYEGDDVVAGGLIC